MRVLGPAKASSVKAASRSDFGPQSDFKLRSRLPEHITKDSPKIFELVQRRLHVQPPRSSVSP